MAIIIANVQCFNKTILLLILIRISPTATQKSTNSFITDIMECLEIRLIHTFNVYLQKNHRDKIL